MPAGLDLTFDGLARWCEDRGRDLAATDLRPAFGAVTLLLASETRRHFDEGRGPGGAAWMPLKHPRPRGGDKPLRDTGLLMGSFTAGAPDHIERVGPLSLEWGTNHEGAGLHQAGGVVRPTKARALAIPLTVEAVRAGSPRHFPRKLFVAGRSLAERKGRGKSARVVPHFALAASVTIPARPMLGWDDELAGRCGEIFLDRLAIDWRTA